MTKVVVIVAASMMTSVGVLVGGWKVAAGLSSVPFLSCPSADRELAHDIASDPAIEQLSRTYPEGPRPHEGCDEDDRTVSASAEYRTGLPRSEALRAGGTALELNGWRGLGTCFTKRIGERRVWADVSYQDRYRSDPDSDLLVSLVNLRSAYC